MSILILVTGILVSIVFDRQQWRHRIDLKWEYRRLNLPMPDPPPKLSALQAWLNIVLGVILFALGCMHIATIILMVQMPTELRLNTASSAMLFTGGGAALLVLGVSALIERRRWNKRTH
ncbi:MAG TPA: hypothetical protein VK470_07070 [Bacteroidota bacterium]|nr:hypothetical protein [Bacteroidota bacterium]